MDNIKWVKVTDPGIIRAIDTSGIQSDRMKTYGIRWVPAHVVANIKFFTEYCALNDCTTYAGMTLAEFLRSAK